MIFLSGVILDVRESQRKDLGVHPNEWSTCTRSGYPLMVQRTNMAIIRALLQIVLATRTFAVEKIQFDF